MAAHRQKPGVVASRARLRIEPTGSAARVPRDYVVTVELWPSGPTAETVARAQALAETALSGLAPGKTVSAQPVPPERQGSGGRESIVAASLESGVESVVVHAGWPARPLIAGLRATLMEHGYEVTIGERRACAEPGCTADALVPWLRRDERPPDWYSESVCGRHNYRACTSCGSVFRLISSTATGPAPSVPCSICHVLLVEWGGSKHWEAELVSPRR